MQTTNGKKYIVNLESMSENIVAKFNHVYLLKQNDGLECHRRLNLYEESEPQDRIMLEDLKTANGKRTKLSIHNNNLPNFLRGMIKDDIELQFGIILKDEELNDNKVRNNFGLNEVVWKDEKKPQAESYTYYLDQQKLEIGLFNWATALSKYMPEYMLQGSYADYIKQNEVKYINNQDLLQSNYIQPSNKPDIEMESLDDSMSKLNIQGSHVDYIKQNEVKYINNQDLLQSNYIQPSNKADMEMESLDDSEYVMVSSAAVKSSYADYIKSNNNPKTTNEKKNEITENISYQGYISNSIKKFTNVFRK